MLTNVKLGKAQLPKIIQSGWFFWALLDKLAGLLMEISAPLTRNVLAPLATTASAAVIDAAIQRETRGRGAIATSGIKMKKISRNPGVLIDEVSETRKHKIKKARRWIFWCY